MVDIPKSWTYTPTLCEGGCCVNGEGSFACKPNPTSGVDCDYDWRVSWDSDLSSKRGWGGMTRALNPGRLRGVTGQEAQRQSDLLAAQMKERFNERCQSAFAQAAEFSSSRSSSVRNLNLPIALGGLALATILVIKIRQALGSGKRNEEASLGSFQSLWQRLFG